MLTRAELAEIRARIHPTKEGKLAFGGQLLDALEAYAAARARTTGKEVDTAATDVVDVFAYLQRDAERLLAEVERLNSLLERYRSTSSS